MRRIGYNFDEIWQELLNKNLDSPTKLLAIFLQTNTQFSGMKSEDLPVTELSEILEIDQKNISSSLQQLEKINFFQKILIQSDIDAVFNYWKEVMHHPHAKLDKKRSGKIRAALKLYTVKELMDAIVGCSLDPWYMGKDPMNQKVFDDINLILRDSSKIDRFIELTQRHQEMFKKRERKRFKCGIEGCDAEAEINAPLCSKHMFEERYMQLTGKKWEKN